MKSLRYVLGLTASAAMLQAGSAEAAHLPEGWVAYDRAREIEIALSAGPKHLRDKAGVYVLDNGRFELARPSGNGFTCIVVRSGAIQAPECYDAEGAATTLPVVLREMQLALEGKPAAEVDRIVGEEYAAGRLLAPRRPGIVYMLSREFLQHEHGGAAKTVFPPHLMFYAPNLTNADIGARPEHFNDPSFPFVLHQGKPYAYIIVVPRDLEALTGER